MSTSLEDAVAEQLRELAVRAAPAVRARPDAAERALTAARKRRRTSRRRRTSAGIALGLIAGGAVAAALLPGRSPYLTVYEPSASMMPTVQVGQDVLVARHLRPTEGDVVVVSLRQSGQAYTTIRRVIAVGGDTVSCPPIAGRCAGVVLDGRRLDETYLAGITTPFPAVTVPAGDVFLLGDNRQDSVDSRQYGSVPLSQVRGVVVRIDRGGQFTAVPGAPSHPGPGPGQNIDPPGTRPSASVGAA